MGQNVFKEDFNTISNFEHWQKSPEVEYAFVTGVEGSNFARFHPTYNNRYLQSPSIAVTSGKYALVFEWSKNSVSEEDSTIVSYSINNGQSWRKIKTLIGGTMREWTKDSTIMELSASEIIFRWQYSTNKKYPSTYFNIDNIKLVKNQNPLNTKIIMDIDIDLYPNPTQDFLNLKINSDITHNISLVITDESGKLMTFIDHLTPKVIVPVSSYPSGIYVCNIQSKEAIFSTTFIKMP